MTLICCNCLKLQLRIQKSWMHPLFRGKRTADAFPRFSHDCVYTGTNNKARYSCTDAALILSFQGQSKDAGCLGSCRRGSGVTQRAVPVQVCGGLKQPRKRESHDQLWRKEQVLIPFQLHSYLSVSLSLQLHSPANQVMSLVSSPSPPHLLLFPSHYLHFITESLYLLKLVLLLWDNIHYLRHLKEV